MTSESTAAEEKLDLSASTVSLLDCAQEFERLEALTEHWRELHYAMRDELDRVVADLLAVRREHAGVCDALKEKVTAYDELRSEFELHKQESERVANEWRLEGEAIMVPRSAVVHNPSSLQTLLGARRAYGHAVLHCMKLKEELQKNQTQVSAYAVQIENMRSELRRWQHAYDEQRHALDSAELAVQELLTVVVDCDRQLSQHEQPPQQQQPSSMSLSSMARNAAAPHIASSTLNYQRLAASTSSPKLVPRAIASATASNAAVVAAADGSASMPNDAAPDDDVDGAQQSRAPVPVTYHELPAVESQQQQQQQQHHQSHDASLLESPALLPSRLLAVPQQPQAKAPLDRSPRHIRCGFVPSQNETNLFFLWF